MRRTAEYRHDWHGCEDLTESATPGRFLRRSLLKAAVFRDAHTDPALTETPAARQVMIGQILDVSPHVIILQTTAGEERLPLTPATTAWRGGPVAPAALRHGDRALVRRPGAAAERIWAEIGRVTGTIIETDGAVLLVDEGPSKGRKIVIIDGGSHRQIQVRFPRLHPGYLIDVIGLRRQGFLQALTPATAQPPYLAAHPPAPPMISGHVPDPVSGTAVWHEPGEEADDLFGLAYPALDPETGCEHGGAAQRGSGPEPYAVDPHTAGPGCVRLPYLSVGSIVQLRNECSGGGGALPVTSCGAAARLFCDRCVQCGTSPKGRIADLTMAAFAELGGQLEAGCFNATMTLPGIGGI